MLQLRPGFDPQAQQPLPPGCHKKIKQEDMQQSKKIVFNALVWINLETNKLAQDAFKLKEKIMRKSKSII